MHMKNLSSMAIVLHETWKEKGDCCLCASSMVVSYTISVELTNNVDIK